ncbi:MAG: hypothetical protein ACYS8Z_01215 [Planctomycetota bacterium]|jgi:hypothetical protein
MGVKKVLGWMCLLCPMNLLLYGCGPAPTPKSLDEIILREGFYTTEHGKSLSQKYRNELRQVANSIRGKYSFIELEFASPPPGDNANAIGLYFGVEQNDTKREKTYVCVNMYTTTRFNTIQSDYNSRAVTVFTKYGRPLFGALHKSGITEDSDVFGISVGLSWYAENFLSHRGTWEHITIFAKTEDAEQFLDNRITDRDFLSRVRIYGAQGNNQLGLIELDLLRRM